MRNLFVLVFLFAQTLAAQEMLYGTLESTKWTPEKDEHCIVRKIQRGQTFRFVLIRRGTITWYPLLVAGHFTFDPKKEYRFSVRARADVPGSISISIGQDGPTWDGLGFKEKLPLTKDWQTFTFVFRPEKYSGNGRFIIGGFQEQGYEFQHSSLTEVP